MLVILENDDDKAIIFKHVTNFAETNYSIDEQLLGHTREHRTQRRLLLKENKECTIEKLMILFEQGKLQVDGKSYKGQHKTPSLREVLTPDTQQALDRMNMEVCRGNEIKIQNSTFIGYSAVVENLKQVNDAYAKVRQTNGDARHVMCAFRIPHEKYHIYQNYNDDVEFGGGRLLLSLLRRSEIMNRMLIVVHKYDGDHVGQDRFDAIARTAKSVMTIHPFNALTKENQYLWTVRNKDMNSGANSANRGRGGFRGQYSYKASTGVMGRGVPLGQESGSRPRRVNGTGSSNHQTLNTTSYAGAELGGTSNRSWSDVAGAMGT